MMDLKMVIDHLPNAIFVVDRDRRVLLANRLAKDFHCFAQQEKKTRRIGEMVGCMNADDDVAGCGSSGFCHLCQTKAMIEQTFATKKRSAQFETNISTRSMGVRSLKVTVNYVGLNDRPTSERELCIVTVDDLTEFKKKEQLAAAYETIGAICHEMNQPLQAIMGNVELLANFEREDGAIARIEKIYSEMDRIKRIINKLLNITNYQTKPYLSTRILDIEKSASL